MSTVNILAKRRHDSASSRPRTELPQGVFPRQAKP